MLTRETYSQEPRSGTGTCATLLARSQSLTSRVLEPAPARAEPCTIDCVNAEGVTAGSYIDASNAYHGFVRAGDGRITEFDVRGAGSGSGQGTVPYGINLLGQIEGAYVDGSYVYHGFVRAGDGSITKFDVRGAGTGSGQGTSPQTSMTGGRSQESTLTRTACITASCDPPMAGSRRSMFQERAQAAVKALFLTATTRREQSTDGT